MPTGTSQRDPLVAGPCTGSSRISQAANPSTTSDSTASCACLPQALADAGIAACRETTGLFTFSRHSSAVGLTCMAVVGVAVAVRLGRLDSVVARLIKHWEIRESGQLRQATHSVPSPQSLAAAGLLPSVALRAAGH